MTSNMMSIVENRYRPITETDNYYLNLYSYIIQCNEITVGFILCHRTLLYGNPNGSFLLSLELS